jgi:hypothetical protein
MMVATMIVQCDDLHHGEIISSIPAFLGTTVATHHAYVPSRQMRLNN